MTEAKKLKVLSLDGGGIRGLSSLLVLKRIMWQAGSFMDPPRRNLQPYEYFDLIGGTSTGGIIAIMLGRLRMTIDECLEEYSTLSRTVFGTRQGIGQREMYKASVLEETIKGVIRRKLGNTNADAPLFDPLGEYCCKTVVYTIPRARVNVVRAQALRSYDSKLAPPTLCTIWQAARATSAAPIFFEPIHFEGKYWIDAGLGFNNPCKLIREEIGHIWSDRSGNLAYNNIVGCFLSIGTGFQDGARLNGDSVNARVSAKLQIPLEAVEAMQKIVTGTEDAALDLEKFFAKDIFHRFNVEQGLQDVKLFDYERLEDVATDTEDYLQRRYANVSNCVLRMSTLLPTPSPFHQALNTSNLIAYRNDEQETYAPVDLSELGIEPRTFVRNRKKMEANASCVAQLSNSMETSHLWDRLVQADILEKRGRGILNGAGEHAIIIPQSTGPSTSNLDTNEELNDLLRRHRDAHKPILDSFKIYSSLDFRLGATFEGSTDFYWNTNRLAGIAELMGMRREAKELFLKAARGRTKLLGEQDKATQRSIAKVNQLHNADDDLIQFEEDTRDIVQDSNGGFHHENSHRGPSGSPASEADGISQLEVNVNAHSSEQIPPQENTGAQDEDALPEDPRKMQAMFAR